MPTRCDARGDDAVAREGTEREASSGRRAREARNFKVHQPIPAAPGVAARS